MSTNSVSIEARTAPRDGMDVGLALLLIVPVGALFFGVPVLVVYLLSRNLSVSVAVGGVFFLLLFLLLSLFAFRELSMNSQGITFERYVGRSYVRVSWDSIRTIELTSRWEVFLRVWLWPGLPPRGSILCMSARDHYRIQWNGTCYYFSPRNSADFDQVLNEWKKHTDKPTRAAEVRPNEALNPARNRPAS